MEKNNQINPRCKKCKGTGIIRFFFDCDVTRDCKSPKCFPEEKENYEKINRCFININE